jgi:hypothetical protein
MCPSKEERKGIVEEKEGCKIENYLLKNKLLN